MCTIWSCTHPPGTQKRPAISQPTRMPLSRLQIIRSQKLCNPTGSSGGHQPKITLPNSWLGESAAGGSSMKRNRRQCPSTAVILLLIPFWCWESIWVPVLCGKHFFAVGHAHHRLQQLMSCHILDRSSSSWVNEAQEWQNEVPGNGKRFHDHVSLVHNIQCPGFIIKIPRCSSVCP